MITKLKKHHACHVWFGSKRYYATPVGDFPGVTTVLSATKSEKDKAGLQRWRKSVGEVEAERIKNDAIARGNHLHSCLENYLESALLPEDPTNPWWQSVQPFLSRVGNVALIEGAIWHPEGFAGSVDCVAEVDGKLSIIDWKTSGKPKKIEYITDYLQQVAAYCAGVNRVYGTRIDRGYVVVALDNDDAQIFDVTGHDLMQHWHDFKSRVRMFHREEF
jgi:genome maintenance exonuclease 1